MTSGAFLVLLPYVRINKIKQKIDGIYDIWYCNTKKIKYDDMK